METSRSKLLSDFYEFNPSFYAVLFQDGYEFYILFQITVVY